MSDRRERRVIQHTGIGDVRKTGSIASSTLQGHCDIAFWVDGNYDENDTGTSIA